MRTCRNLSVFATYRPDVLPETTGDPAEWNQASARRLWLLCDRRLIFGRRNVPTLLSRLFPSTYEYTGWGGIRTRGTLRYTRFPGVPDRPLWHPSKKQGGDSEAETPEFQLKLAEGGGSAFRVSGRCKPPVEWVRPASEVGLCGRHGLRGLCGRYKIAHAKKE
jgi:hypothetical protein